jgi:hypothetical protein
MFGESPLILNVTAINYNTGLCVVVPISYSQALLARHVETS